MILRIVISKIKSLANKWGFKFLLPLIYILGLVFSLVLFLLTNVFPSLLGGCGPGGWPPICIPIGLGFAVLFSFPGYLASRLLGLSGLLGEVGWYGLIIFFLISISIYFAIGLIIDKCKTVKSRLLTVILFGLIIFVIPPLIYKTVEFYEFQKSRQIPNKKTGITREEDSKILPLPPSNVKAEVSREGVTVRWLGTGSDIIKHYKVQRRISYITDWQIIDEVKIVGDNESWYEIKDVPMRNRSYIYGVSAVDIYSNESAVTESKIVWIPRK